MRIRRTLSILFLSLVAAGAAHAQSDEDRLRAQLRQLTLQVRQLQDDQATVEAGRIAAEQQRDAVKKELADAQAEIARLKHDTGRMAAMQQDLSQAKDQLNQAGEAAKQNEAERDKLKQDVATTGNVLDACEAKNVKLIKVGHEILAAYERFDFGDALGANEPFLRLERVKLENMAQDMDDGIEDGRFDPNAVRPPEPKTPASENRPADHGS